MNGLANPLSWSKGLLDGVNSVDIELARLSTDGLLKVALNGMSYPLLLIYKT